MVGIHIGSINNSNILHIVDFNLTKTTALPNSQQRKIKLTFFDVAGLNEYCL